jgi:septal ring factor EnvC (AmiA/AmiB activator)
MRILLGSRLAEIGQEVGIRNYSSVSTTGTKGQDRLDRLEKMAEAMFAGIAELKESQAKTDEQIRELKESQARTDEQMRRTDAKVDRIGQQLGDLGLVQGEVADEGGATLLNREEFEPKTFN